MTLVWFIVLTVWILGTVLLAFYLSWDIAKELKKHRLQGWLEPSLQEKWGAGLSIVVISLIWPISYSFIIGRYLKRKKLSTLGY